MKAKKYDLLIVLVSTLLTEIIISFCKYRAYFSIVPSIGSIINLLILALICCFLLELFNKRFNSSYSDKALFYYSILFSFFILAVFHAFYFPYYNAEQNSLYIPFSAIAFIVVAQLALNQLFIIKNRKSIIFMLTSCVIVGIVGLFSYVTHYRYSSKLLYYVIVIAVLSSPFIIHSKSLPIINTSIKSLTKSFIKNCSIANKIFTLCALISGLLLCVFLPVTSVVTWDDSYHYCHFLALSQSDFVATDGFDTVGTIYPLDHSLTKESRANRSQIIDDLEHNTFINDCFIDSDALAITRIGYLGFLPGFFLSSILNLPKHISFILGKISNLLIYIAIINLAICKLKSGKYVLALISLFPSVLFLTCNYSYDSWTFMFLCLAMAIFFSLFQSPSFYGSKDIKKLTIITLIAVLAKPGYAFFLLFLLILPKTAFSTKDSKKKLLLATLLLTICFLIGFYIYYFIIRSGAGDHRGGDTSIIRQLQFIKDNPADFLSIINAFLFNEYLTYSTIIPLTSAMAYVGVSSTNVGIIMFISVVFLSILDSHQEKNCISIKTRFSGIILIFLFIFLTALGLYLIFTPVGHTTVNGCQVRYLLPFVFPTVMILFNGWLNDLSKYCKPLCTLLFLSNAILGIYSITTHVLLSQI